MKKSGNEAADRVDSAEDDNTIKNSLNNIDDIREWLIRTTKTFTIFAFVLSGLCLTLILTNVLHLPIYVSYLIVFVISAVLFMLLIKIAIENIVYKYLKKSIWGQVIVYLLGVIISAQSYLWAANEINRIFLVNPNALALTLTSLTAIQFFKYTIIVLLGSYFIAIGLYFFYRYFEDETVQNASIGHPKQLSKKVTLGALFVITVVVCLLTVGKISKYSDVIIQAFALKVDFSSYSTCTGEDFNDIDGVIFLSASDILVAKKMKSMTWEFKKVSCEP